MEVILFLGVGIIAVFSAMMMLLEENAVHSALFLIVNFLCVAILYIMLDAPFLAMIQIAVYAGAIMVLFLFVIMLLGAEQVGSEDPGLNYRGISFFALVLAVVFVLAMAFAFISGDIDNREIPEDQPLVRVLNFAPDLEVADFLVNDAVVIEHSEFDLAPDGEFVSVEVGESGAVTLNMRTEFDGEQYVDPLGDFTLEAGHAYSFILYGTDLTPSVALVETDLSDFEDSNQSRLVVFNALSTIGAVGIGDIGSDYVISSGENVDVVVPAIAVGEASEAVIVEEGRQGWGLVDVIVNEPSEGESEAQIDTSLILPMREYEIEARDSQLLVLAERRQASDGSLVPVVIPVHIDSEFAFGSPQVIGESLFIQYVLPFEMVAVLLLAAMVGAITLAQRGDIKPKPGRPIRRKVSRPLTAVIASQTGSNVMRSIPELEPQVEDGEETEASESDEADEQAEPTGN